MTVTYSPEVATVSYYCMFWKAMKMYRGSIYKIIWRDLLFFIVIFLTLQFTSLYVLSESQQLGFKRMRDSFYMKRKYIPMHFVLGFFVLLVVDRWRVIQMSIPSADTFCLLVNSAINSNSERSRLMRRATVRYTIASYIINLKTISLKMRNRFPTFQSIVSLGILLKNEEEILEKIEKQTLMTTYVIPLVWATNIINRARKEGLINNDCIMQELLNELGNYRRKLGVLLRYDLVCIPLFYIQVVTISMYSYYFTTVIGNQVCRNEDGVSFMEIVVSLLGSSLDFTFHVGWVKVAEVLINPFGEDDEDFEVDRMVDRNLKAGYMIVDYMRVKKSNYHSYDYPVFGNEGEARNKESHLYYSIEEDVATQTEDKYFQMYENVPVTTAPLQLQNPSQSSSSVDYVNVINKIDAIYESIPNNQINSSKSDERKPKEMNNYGNVPTRVQLQTSPQSLSNLDTIYENIPIKEVKASESDATKLEETNVYGHFPVVPAPLQLQTSPQSSSNIGFLDNIYENIPITEVKASESEATKLEETNVYDHFPVAPATLQLQTPPQSSSYVHYVNVICKNIPNDEVSSSESDGGKQEENNIYANVSVDPTSLQIHSPSHSLSSVDYVNVRPGKISTPTDEIIFSTTDPRTMEEGNKNVTYKQSKKTNIFSLFAKFKFNKKK